MGAPTADGELALVIISCDELGFCQAANEATYALLRDGVATSTSLMVPAPWSRAAAAEYRGEGAGVDLTIVSEHDRYRWGPITHAPSLLDGDGAFPRTIADVWEHADLDEVRREWHAQVERAVLWGFDATHLVVHLDELAQRPEFFDAFVDLAEDFALPARLAGAGEEWQLGFPMRELARERGILAPDETHALERLGSTPAEVAAAVARFAPGLHEIVARVAYDTPELRGATPQWRERVAAYELLRTVPWPDLPIRRTSYRELAHSMRSGAAR